jgi:putative ABC transport system ATP-binding protein
MTLVKLNAVHKSYTTGGEVTRVLKGLKLSAKEGEMIMIMGPSGSGKTTLLNIMGGIDKPDKGVVQVAGKELTGLSWPKLGLYRREKVGFIFQFYNLLPTLTARENVELGIETLVKDRKELARRAEKYLKLVDLADKMGNFPQELSAGEQQRVAIARALAKEPAIVLADEPTGNLDEDRGQSVMKLMKKLQKDVNMTFFIVSHNAALGTFADRTLVLRRGKLEKAEQMRRETKLRSRPAKSGGKRGRDGGEAEAHLRSFRPPHGNSNFLHNEKHGG